MPSYSLSHLSDAALHRDHTAHLARHRRDTAMELAFLGEIDARRLFLSAAYPSMFAYCLEALHLSEDCAYKHIRGARLARRFPEIFDALAHGRLHLSGIVLLSAVLTEENSRELVAAAEHRTKAEIELTLAARSPRPDVPERVAALTQAPATAKELHGQLAPGPVGMTTTEQLLERSAEPVGSHGSVKLSGNGPETCEGIHLEPATAESSAAFYRPPAIAAAATEARAKVFPLSAERFALQCTVGRETYDNLCRAKALLRHQLPSGDLSQVLDRALETLVRELERRKLAATDRPRQSPASTDSTSRRIPAEVRRTVWKRDGGRCTFVSEQGRQCSTREHLEFDHAEPVARGGRTTVGNLRLRCRAHNQFDAERIYGAEFMRGKRLEARERSGDREQ